MDEVEPNQEKYDVTLASLVKKDDDVMVLRLTDGKEHEIRIADPEEPLIILDCIEMLDNLTLNNNDREVLNSTLGLESA